MPKTTKITGQFAGQGTLCNGTCTITLSGPQGCGKSLITKVLKAVLPFTPIDAVVIVEKADG